MEILKDRFLEITEQTKEDLREYGREEKPSLAARIRLLFGRKIPKKDFFNWPVGLLLLGLWEAGETESVRRYFDEYLKKQEIFLRVDDALSGYVLVQLYRETGEETYAEAAHRLYAFLQEAPANAEGSLIYNPQAKNNAIFADGAGMAAMFFACYGMAFQKKEALRRARGELLAFRAHGMEEDPFLPCHGFILDENAKKGVIGWGRAVGWILMGLSVYLQETAAVPDEEVRAFYRALCKSALTYEKDNGLYPWQLKQDEEKTDTSASAMIGFSYLYGGMVTDPRFQEAADRCFTTLYDEATDGVVNGALAECLDFNNHPQNYGHYPWGQGAALAFLSVKRKMHLR